ncbi:MAG: LptF/LptG family permease [Muribaculaceae bacterium]|nr:LptF/LptG family permease [Muribaculaceae bacterium]
MKRLYSYMLQRFLPLFAMTFFICLFIVMMQFLWKSIDDLVGKGLGVDIIGELFFYAALTMVPMALPLAVLLASLMVFGNLGEKFELTAMKASGISLFRIMRPLMVFMAFVAVGAFFFQNNVLPVAQTKMWTLLFSVRQKSPEVEIPERSFYGAIPNMQLYVGSKDAGTGMLYDMLIYDFSRGQDNSRVILADSGRFNFTEDRTRLFLHLHSGELFENVHDNSMGVNSGRYLPFRREHFTDKQVYFPFDANFNRVDEGGLRSQYIGQNVSQLRHSIDSISHRVDSIGNVYASEILSVPYFGLTPTVNRIENGEYVRVPRREVTLERPLNVDSLFQEPNPGFAKSYIQQALAKARRQKQEYVYRSLALAEQAKLMRRHDIEMQKKFTLSFACIIFFFIGAPLGAIIKKGGLGTPLIISVLLFIVYFIIDNAGYKMARDGKTDVWIGIWLSSFVLLPLGVFFTYKAVGDSAVFNFDAYANFFRRLTGREAPRSLAVKEVIMNDTDVAEALRRLEAFGAAAEAERARLSRLSPVRRLFARGLDPALGTALNELVDYLADSRDKHVVNLLNRYPFRITRRRLPAVIETTQLIVERINTRQQE